VKFQKIEQSEAFSPSRFALAIAQLRASSRLYATVIYPDLTLTDREGPRGAGEYLRKEILKNVDPSDWSHPAHWLTESDWWEQVADVADELELSLE